MSEQNEELGFKFMFGLMVFAFGMTTFAVLLLKWLIFLWRAL